MFFPSGTYLVSSTINVPSNVILRGSKSTSILKANAAGLNLLTIQSASNIAIEQLTLQGNNSAIAGTPSGGNGLVATGATNVTVRDCEFHGFGDSADIGASAIYFYAGNQEITIVGNYIDGGLGDNNGSDINIYSAGGNVLVESNRCYSANSNGIATNLTSAPGKVIIRGNICKNHKRHGIIPVYGGSGSMDTIVANNLCVDNASTGIYVNSGSAGTFVIEGNIIDSCSGGGKNSVGGGNGSTIAGGIVLGGGGGAGLARKLVSGNFIYNTGRTSAGLPREGYTDADVNQSTAIRIVNDDNSIVVNNFIDTSIGSGIRVYNQVSQAIIKNNKIIKTAIYAIEVLTTSHISNLEIVGNHIDNSGSDGHGIYLSYVPLSADNLTITNNVIKGKRTAGTFGLFLLHAFNGGIEGNYVDSWDIAINASSPAAAALLGSSVRFAQNTMLNSNTGLSYYLNSGQFAFGLDNRYVGNTADEVAVSLANHRNATHSVFKPGSNATVRAFFDTAPPTSGTWKVGDIVYNKAPPAVGAGYVGWLCVTDGTPGDWRPFGALG